MKYVCLGCGTTTGTPAGEKSENWYWLLVRHGRIGPFHAEECSSRFRYPAESEDRFTIREWGDLSLLQHIYQEGR